MVAGWQKELPLSASDANGNLEIHTMNADGTGDHSNLRTDAATDEQPVWSPDGTKILFISTRDGGDTDIFVMDANGGGNVMPLTSNTGDERRAMWSPDGTKIAYSVETVSGAAVAAGEMHQPRAR